MDNSDGLVAKALEVISERIDLAAQVSLETGLLGGPTPVDSVSLVEVCVGLEELGEQNGFEFDWTSEAAMSQSKSMFLTVGSLVDEFCRQAAKGAS
jgi:hypothetical protein